MNTILTYLKTKATQHVLAVAVSIGAVIAGRSWLAEHDARLKADAAVQTAQTQIKSLQAQQATVTQAAKVQVVTIQAAAAKVTTATQAVAAIPSVDPNPSAPLDAKPDVDDATKTSVNAVPLYQDLAVCKETAVNLGACSAKLDLQTQIDTQKDTEIIALKKNPGFWHTVKQTAISVGIGVAVGYALHSAH